MLPLYVMYHSDVVVCFGVWLRKATVNSQLQPSDSAVGNMTGP